MKKLTSLLLLFVIPIFTLCSQNCSVTITSLSNEGPGNPPPAVHISVKGKAVKCGKVKVELCCADILSNPCRIQEVAVKDDGTWSTVLKDFACTCIPNSFVVIATASCVDNNNCTGDQERLEIICQPNNPCCNVSNVITTIGNCIDDESGCKKRQVTFNPIVSGNCDFHTWNFGDNSPGITIAGPPTSIVHDYFHYPQSFPTLTTIGANCNPPGSEFQVTNLQNFPICDDCPLPAFVDLNQITINNCTLSGTVTADICEEQYVSFVIDYGDGSSESVNINQLNGIQINHNYSSNDDFIFRIILQKNGGNCPYSKSITISNCGIGGGGGGGGGGGDGCIFCFCSVSIWCCIAYIFFILALISTMISLAFALCNGNSAAWISFGISLALAIALAIVLLTLCDVGICAMLIAIASAGTINWGIICGTSLIPCTTWLCAKTTIPIFGGTQNFLIVAVVLWLLTLIFCNT